MQGVANKHINIFGAILHDSSPAKSQIFTIKEFVKDFYWLPITSEHFSTLELKSFYFQN